MLIGAKSVTGEIQIANLVMANLGEQGRGILILELAKYLDQCAKQINE